MDRAPINLVEIDIVCVDKLQYLGSSIHHCCCPSDDVDARVAAASSACGSLQKPVFSVRYLDIHIERCVFNACTLSLLIYGSECWTPLQCDTRRLSSFHMRCICSILGITRAQAWVERISAAELFVLWGDVGTIIRKLGHRRLDWFGLLPEWRIAGCLGTFFSNVIPPVDYGIDGKMVLSGTCDLLICLPLGVTWHVRPGRLGPTHTLLWLITSLTCSLFNALFAIRFFPRPNGRARHKCSADGARPVLDQKGTRPCNRCDRCLRSAGGMAVHLSSVFPSNSAPISVTVIYLSQVGSTAVGLGCC